ncbi:muscleblind-like protein 2 [Caerostris extrusa]|uniref:Muscleblind-like protein 2 n=1 Tax=Caerostris extrusa TaxID=172846 RepID=A0AAV4M9U4_CAEEX|nr:muscleblind-like protein 2 [Caerostris extrusa]
MTRFWISFSSEEKRRSDREKKKEVKKAEKAFPPRRPFLILISGEYGRCNREKPPCKYFHPPQHLKDQLLINGRNHLALKNAIMQQLPLQPLLQPPTAQLAPAVVSIMNASTSPYMQALPGHTASSFSPYLSPSAMIPAGMMPADLAPPPPPPQLTSIVHTPIVAQKIPAPIDWRIQPTATRYPLLVGVIHFGAIGHIRSVVSEFPELAVLFVRKKALIFSQKETI